MMARIAQCRTCHRDIIWCVTELGKKMPLDADPVSDGNFILDGEVARAQGRHRGPGNRFMSHFATCPNAKQHRKPKQTDAEIDAARDKAIAAVDKKPDPNPAETVTEFAEELMMMIGEAITDDVEAWEQVLGIPGPSRCLRVTWQGHEFQIDIMQVNR